MNPNAAYQGPRPSQIRLAALLAALAAGPAAWALQLIAGYGVSSLACFPHDAPIQIAPPPGWSAEPGLLLAINLACLLLALIGFAICLRDWRTPLGGESQSRTRFLAMCGMFAGLGFALAILFDTAIILGTPTCWNILS
jgi:hypothetical protein